ncbi:hypothetical protein B0H66DRAFT_560440 [Apodospora peruviana]|uniref:Uncharacterized protein n=1 Tax=Apodospora peruviana TaxID=516989 RepID=A0AAE0M327_9PEZI|nr:hypothetical protein B0H66DRAFT_560440 [Apodospora peruviana]
MERIKVRAFLLLPYLLPSCLPAQKRPRMLWGRLLQMPQMVSRGQGQMEASRQPCLSCQIRSYPAEVTPCKKAPLPGKSSEKLRGGSIDSGTPT